jgi:hypothetical protein
MRRLVSKEELHSQVTVLVTQAEARRSLSQDERNHLQEIKAVLGPAKAEAPPTSANAFGLIDPAKLPTYPLPQDRGVMLHSPNTLVLLQQLDALLTSHLDVEFQTLDYKREPRQTTIRQGGVPYTGRDLSLVDDRESFPLLHVWEEWWQNRSQELRDPDGFELERMAVLLSVHENIPPHGLILLYGISSLPNWPNKNHMEKLIAWLRKRFDRLDWRKFVMNAAEQALFVAREEKDLWQAGKWLQFASSQVISRVSGATEEPSGADLLHYWQMKHSPIGSRAAILYLWDVLKAFVLGVISERRIHLVAARRQGSEPLLRRQAVCRFRGDYVLALHS